MKYRIFVVRDQASESYLQPFMKRAQGEAARDFTKAINTPNENSPMWQHPEHFALYELGTFDDNTGMYETGVPKVLLHGNEVMQQRPQQKLDFDEVPTHNMTPEKFQEMTRSNGNATR